MAKLPERFCRAWRILPGIMLLTIPVLAWRVVGEYRGVQTQVVAAEPAVTITASPTEPGEGTRIGSDWTERLTSQARQIDAVEWMEDRGSLTQVRKIPLIGGPVAIVEDTLQGLLKLRKLTAPRKRRR